MRIIRPYGRSVVKRGEKRKIVPRTESLCAIPDFAENNPHIIIAQWISALDKVIAKPRGTHKASRELYNLRDKLGNACWDRMIARHESLRTMKKVWQWKLHPYGEPEPEDAGKKHKRSKPDTPRKGRWYTAFARETDFDQLDFEGIAEALKDHLYRNQRRIHDGDPRSTRTEHKKGLIAARAESVAKSLPAPADEKESIGWTEQDEQQFLKFSRDPAVDPAVIICSENSKLESTKKRSIFSNAAGKVIAECYGKYFSDPAGGFLTRQAIRDAGRVGELSLWDAVRTYYRRLLSAKPKPELNRTLPKDAKALVALLRAQGANRRINDLIRLGRLLHYDRDSAQGDSAPDFDSDKQADIKRAEAFVRVWRTAISQARCTVANWIDLEKRADTDILGGKDALLNHFEETFQTQQAQAEQHAALLFGAHVDVFRDVALKDLCLSLAHLTMQCRHKVVHFTSREDFVSKVKNELSKEGGEEKLKAALSKSKQSLCALFDRDLQSSGEQIVKEITGAKLPHFARQEEMVAFVRCVGVLDDTDITLPRFRRLLLRLENTRQSGKLPRPENISSLYDELARLEKQAGDSAARERTKREAALARYTGLKMLYERPFRRWLAKREARELNAWLQEACDRATQAAHKLNGRNSDYTDLIVAKAAEVTPLQNGERITDFMQRLTALTASEMRVQKGYDSNPAQARKQAGWIDNLLCDVLGRAFHDFLKSQDAACGWLLRLDPAKHRQNPVEVALPALPKDQTPDWLKLLYAVLYMISRDDVSRLLHQFRKWETLEAKAGRQTDADSAGLRRVLTLCLHMSEAKFDGQEAAYADNEIRCFFEKQADFDRAFPVAEGGALLATRRGLRQIMRFGHLLLLRPIFAQHRIASKDVEALQKLERAGETGLSKIAQAQGDRKKLHETLARKKAISNDELKRYQSVLNTITEHRDLCAKVRLTNHLRLHRLMIRLWSRLLDFAGLWERDRFFVCLAWMKRKGFDPQNVWPGPSGKEKRRRFRKGEAKLNDFRDTPVWNQVEKLFSEMQYDLSYSSKIRNALAHFDFLGNDWSDNLTRPNFTTYVNDVRDLMAYDRKLKNAVSKSVIDILDEEGFTLTWDMNDEYRLCSPVVKSKKLQHFKKSSKKIWEPMHNNQLVAMVASLFGQEKSARRCATRQARGRGTYPQKNAGGYGSGRKK